MKKIFLFFVMSSLVLSLSAQHRESENILKKLIWDDEMLNIFLDMRVDGQAQFQNNELDQTGFRGQTLRMWIAGEIVPGVRYRVRHRFNKPQDPLIRDNYSSATDHAWLAFDIKDKWAITVGKQSMQLGTFEYDYSGADLYLTTMVNGDIDMYKTGVNAAYTVANQTFNLQVVNSDAPQFATEEYKNKSFNFNFMWQGNLWNDRLKTRCGYGLFQHDKTKFYHWLTAGLQVNAGRFTSELDYFLGDRNIDYGSVVDNSTLGLRAVKDQSAALTLKYSLDNWHFLAKGTWNDRHDKQFGSDAYNSCGAQAAVEFYPFERKELKFLRFHFAYVYQNTDFKGHFKSLSNHDSHLLLLGTRWLFKAK